MRRIGSIVCLSVSVLLLSTISARASSTDGGTPGEGGTELLDLAVALDKCMGELEAHSALLPQSQLRDWQAPGALWAGLGLLAGTTAGATAGISASQGDWGGVAVGGVLLAAAGLAWWWWMARAENDAA